jgi:hypothetical protein
MIFLKSVNEGLHATPGDGGADLLGRMLSLGNPASWYARAFLPGLRG